jgi:energy-coupling factor transport system substrate-specific component
MSWQAASFLILGVALVGGFAWYERSRPPSQVVALVGALAALAVAGRVAFAAFPNVKPTTDIVIFAGYALGPAPGFAVGAMTALVSNFWFGQGPWTPWQMAAWGLCGIFGAGLALGVRNAGRLTLASACGVAGVAYGALLNFSLLATYGGELSIQSFLILESRAVPFDAAHALGNIVFALIAGPAMVRMLVRFRRRFEWHLPAGATTMLVALALLCLLPAAAGASGASSGAAWLVSVQNGDGGFGPGKGDGSSTETTAWAMLGLEAAGRNPLDVSKGGKTPVDFLRSKVGTLSSAGELARTILALEGAGVEARSFGGKDLVSSLLARRRADGSYEGFPGVTAYAIVALRTAGATGTLGKSQSWLGGAQDADGGWGDQPNGASNADVTGQAMQAMPSSKAAQQGLSYLRQHQRDNGGFALGGSGPVNTQSTAWAAQGMLAVGADAGKALEYIASVQASDGHYRYSSSSDQTPVWVTSEALVPASGEFFPVSVPARKPIPAPQSEPTTVAPAPAVSPVPGPSGSPVLTPPPGSVSPVTPVGGASPKGGSTGHAGPLVPPAGAGSVVPVPLGGGEAPPAAGAAPASSTTGGSGGGGSSSSPWVPIGIGLGAFAVALGVPLALGKRFAW